MAALDKYLALVDEIERDQADLDSLFAQLKSKVLDLAIRGGLTERAPGDEPASELLARIHKEKLAMVERGERLKPKDVRTTPSSTPVPMACAMRSRQTARAKRSA